jgi:anti-sigma regulatory factor (Ser/Thr protein kinase)
VRAEITDDEVRVLVEDDGVGLERWRVDTPARVDVDQTWGRGLHMIRALMTSVAVEPATEAGGTRLVMKKRFDGTH